MCRSNSLRSPAKYFFLLKGCSFLFGFGIMPSTLFHVNQIFCFYLYFNVRKVILLDMNNLYKLQTLIKATLLLIYWHVFLGDPHIYWHVSYEGYFCFKYITFSWEAVIMSICCWKCLCFGHFELFNLPLFVIFYIHPTCTYHVRPASIMSICQFF